MRLSRPSLGLVTMVLATLQPITASLLPRQSADSSSSSSSSASSSSDDQPAAAGQVAPEVAFLQTLQAAQVSSMSCLITLVNMTVNPIGTCLGLTTLADLIARPSDNSSFSAQLNGYLSTTCASGQCSEMDISETRAQLADSCASSGDTTLVTVLRAILDNYTNSYRTLACSVYFNGTGDPCIAENLNTTDAANNNNFFNDLLTGNNLAQYQQSVFEQAECTGCMYELYKASVYMIPNIRGNSVTSAFGNHLQSCGQEAGKDWSNVQDQQIPQSLTVQQSTGTAAGAAVRRVVLGIGEGVGAVGVWRVGMALGMAVMGGRAIKGTLLT